jgi:hypothetical protein
MDAGEKLLNNSYTSFLMLLISSPRTKITTGGNRIPKRPSNATRTDSWQL